jgi:formamidopyrimidine-DNA glycosylase
MPELPDVEVYKRYLDSTALHRKVSDVEVLDAKVLQGMSRKDVSGHLTGRTLSSSHRHGKHLLAQVRDEGWLALHFGMTGFLRYYRNDDEKPDHPRLIIHFSNGYHLAYDLTRKLGRVEWAESVKQFVEKHDLGPDPLDDSLTPERFTELLKGKRGKIKSALMDQSLIAGLGNIYTDEVLFHAGIHPRTDTGSLDEQDMKNLYREIQHVLSKAVESSADPEQLPSGWLLPARGSGKPCPKCGGELTREKVGGRSSWYCTSHQETGT